MFHKDLDTRTCNVHVIPGIVQEWTKYSDKSPIPDKTWVYHFNNEHSFINALFSGKTDNSIWSKGITPFAEQCAKDGGIWYPTETTYAVSVISLFDTLKKYICQRRKTCIKCIGNRFNATVSACNPANSTYSIMRWLNAKPSGSDGAAASLNFYKLVDIENFGVCMLWPSQSTSEKVTNHTRQINAPNDVIKGEHIIKLNYRRIKLNSPQSDGTKEDFDSYICDKCMYIKYLKNTFGKKSGQ